MFKFFINIDIFKNLLIDINIDIDTLKNGVIDINIFKIFLIDIDIDIFKDCQYIDNQYV